MRRYDHIDLRVHSLAEARPFYEAILPALGFTRNVGIEGWLQFELPERMVRLSFLVSPSRRGISPTSAGSPSGRRVPARSIGWLRSSSGQELGTSKVPDTMKGMATMPSFLRTSVAIVWKSAIAPKVPDETRQETRVI